MSDEKSFKKMNKAELKQLFEETFLKIESINSFSQELDKNKQAIQEANEKINGESGFVSQIEKKSKEISDAYNEILIDDEKGDSIKTQIENLLTEFEGGKKKFDELQNSILGYEKTNEAGEVQKIKGLFDEINDFHQKQEEKYAVLYKKIEEELNAGATSVNLSKSFADKVREYRWNSWLWSGCFIVFLLGLVGYYGYITFTTNEVKTTEDVWRHLAFRSPFLIFGVWLVIFFGNRRAESKKLEELYKHKEVMARSFVGYKQTLEKLGEEDKVLLKKHMENLLTAMNENSATFLNSEGDKHPIFELASSLFKSRKKEVKEAKEE